MSERTIYATAGINDINELSLTAFFLNRAKKSTYMEFFPKQVDAFDHLPSFFYHFSAFFMLFSTYIADDFVQVENTRQNIHLNLAFPYIGGKIAVF